MQQLSIPLFSISSPLLVYNGICICVFHSVFQLCAFSKLEYVHTYVRRISFSALEDSGAPYTYVRTCTRWISGLWFPRWKTYSSPVRNDSTPPPPPPGTFCLVYEDGAGDGPLHWPNTDSNSGHSGAVLTPSDRKSYHRNTFAISAMTY